MNLACDENIKTSITEYRRENGRVLLTNDDDFFDFETHPGILFLAYQTTPARDVANAIRHIDRQFSADGLENTVLHVPDGWV